MKVKIVPDSEVYGDQTPEDARDEAKIADDMGLIQEGDPSMFSPNMEVHIPESLLKRLEKMGITVDELVANLTKASGKQQ